MTTTKGLEPQGFEDWAAVHDAVADAYFPHVMTPLQAGTASRSVLTTVDLRLCRITRMKLGAAVSVQSDCPGAYGVNIPVAGEMESVIGRTGVVSGVGQATACPPDTPVCIPRWMPSCHLLGFKVEEGLLRREMERTLARPAKALPLGLDLRSADGQSWLSLLQSILEQACHSDARLLRDERFTAQLAGLVTTGFVLAVMPDDTASRIGTRPRIVRRVMTAIQDDPARSWSPGDMAEIAGVSVRRLQQGFCEYVGQTPSQYLRDVRLEHAHADLVTSGPPATVTDIALRWGFMHMGRFAADYRRKYGWPPSRTLAR